MRARGRAVWLAIAAFVWLLQPAHAQEEKYKVRLATVPMDGGMRDAVAGSGSASVALSGTKLSVTGTFGGLLSQATVARLHQGVVRGVRGPAIGDLVVSKAVSGTISGSVELNAEQLQALRKGQLYLQISSEKAPEGNLWGWLLR